MKGVSSQKIKRAKTTLSFSKLIAHEMQLTIKEAFGVSMVQQYEKYLGRPSFIGQKKDSFANIKQWIWKKIARMRSKALDSNG